MVETGEVERTCADDQMDQTDLQHTIEKIQELHHQVPDEQITGEDSTALPTPMSDQFSIDAREQTRVQIDQLIFLWFRRWFVFIKRRNIVDLIRCFEKRLNVVSTAGQGQEPHQLRQIEEQGLNTEDPRLRNEQNATPIISRILDTHQPLIVDDQRFVSFIGSVWHTHVIRDEIGIVRVAIGSNCFLVSS